ncbi:MAG TPA: HEAT repeat domain-containing protein [Candidatus Norongarragalinales archaeon]|jgi:HEAT repeat protein|nr:HEAT repeat domain-containing protein [Candidatus Norongarragalinales archaeon]
MSKLERFFKHGEPKMVEAHIAKMKNPEKVALALLNYRDQYVPRKAGERLAQLGPAGIEQLKKFIQHPQPLTREGALWGFGHMGEAAEPQVNLIVRHGLRSNRRETTRMIAAFMLGMICSRKALPALKAELKKSEELPEFAKSSYLENDMRAAIKAIETRTPLKIQDFYSKSGV